MSTDGEEVKDAERPGGDTPSAFRRRVAQLRFALARKLVAKSLDVPGLEQMTDADVEDFAVRESRRGRNP